MNILGIGGYSHDSAAALIRDGVVVAAVAEERLTRNKHQGGPPREAVQACLDIAGVAPDDVEHVVAYMKPGLRLRKRMAYRLGTLPRAPHFAAAYMGYEIAHNAAYLRDMRSLCGPNATLHFADHHRAHAAASYFTSGFEDSALLTLDYIGEFTSAWMGTGRGSRIDELRRVDYPHSLGVLYSAMTDYLGFARASDEYKVMGLAPYGEPEFLDEFRRIVPETPDGYQIDLSWFRYPYAPGSRGGYVNGKFIKRFGAPRKKDEPIEDRHKNIAASIQCLLEERVLHLARALHTETGSVNLCLGGGVALNCAMNGRLLRESPFERIAVFPAAGDDGIAVGGALQLHHNLGGAAHSEALQNVRLGPAFDAAASERALESAGLVYTRPADLAGEAAALLADGKIVGWHQDGGEFGPRALGARSILADPTREDMKERVNAKVKFREGFRPFAPSVTVERASDIFEGCAESPFMLFVYPVRAEWRERLPAITHVDGTARVQTVSRDVQPRYHALIEAFGQRSGVPVLLNTSFNVMGEPIVNSPEDAVRCYLACGLDALVVGNFLTVKRDT